MNIDNKAARKVAFSFNFSHQLGLIIEKGCVKLLLVLSIFYSVCTAF